MAKPPRKPTNDAARGGREYLTPEEVDRIRHAAGRIGKAGQRDATMVLLAFRHGLRVSELVRTRWEQIDLDAGTFYVVRSKGSKSGMHTLARDEVNALKKLAGVRDRTGTLFRSNRGLAMTRDNFFKLLRRAAKDVGIPLAVHPHMLRHGCGFALQRAGKPFRLIQEWLGHRNIANTERYTALDPDAFRRAGMWDG